VVVGEGVRVSEAVGVAEGVGVGVTVGVSEAVGVGEAVGEGGREATAALHVGVKLGSKVDMAGPGSPLRDGNVSAVRPAQAAERTNTRRKRRKVSR